MLSMEFSLKPKCHPNTITTKIDLTTRKYNIYIYIYIGDNLRQIPKETTNVHDINVVANK